MPLKHFLGQMGHFWKKKYFSPLKVENTCEIFKIIKVWGINPENGGKTFNNLTKKKKVYLKVLKKALQ